MPEQEVAELSAAANATKEEFLLALAELRGIYSVNAKIQVLFQDLFKSVADLIQTFTGTYNVLMDFTPDLAPMLAPAAIRENSKKATYVGILTRVFEVHSLVARARIGPLQKNSRKATSPGGSGRRPFRGTG